MSTSKTSIYKCIVLNSHGKIKQEMTFDMTLDEQMCKMHCNAMGYLKVYRFVECNCLKIH